ncbi:MAG: sensor histidine kinase [Bacteroidetes bacterium]|nr:MAG: sensor histidine kinase [Bacteroidota bacterium]
MKPANNLHSTEIALRERVKELACLYGISELAHQDNLSLNELLENILKLIPPAWQYPEYTVARIILDSNHFNSAGFQDLPYKQSEKIIINGQQRGIIEVFYIKAMPDADEGPFLKEERKLIQAIAQKLALIIERKETLEEKQKLYEQIRHADRLATIGELTAGIAHEINEPLGTILGFAQLVIKNNNLSQEVKQDLEKIIKAALNAREIIKKLMYFTHQMPQRFEEVDLNQIIKEAMYFLESRCSKENITVSYFLEEQLPLIIADAIQINQVIVNLVVNAIQAMPESGKLTLSTFSNSDFVILTVEDTGMGISEDIKQHIFEPFFTTKEIFKGTGLGLSVVHGIVITHKGEIKVESEYRKGTKFEIKLPVTNFQK